MNGIKFGDKHSITDWDLLMTSRGIGDAEPKEYRVEVPGGNGTKDLSEAFGDVLYNDRILAPTFDMFHKPSEWMQLKDEITNYLSGRKLKIIYDTDPNYYYLGRCKVVDYSNDYTVGHISIEATCEPFKYKIEETVVEINAVQGNTYTFTNDRKSVIPTLILESDMTLGFKNSSFSLSAGEIRVLDIEFTEGTNEIKVIQGNGKLIVKYQEARL